MALITEDLPAPVFPTTPMIVGVSTLCFNKSSNDNQYHYSSNWSILTNLLRPVYSIFVDSRHTLHGRLEMLQKQLGSSHFSFQLFGSSFLNYLLHEDIV